jgi:hypothetical protein
MRAIASLGCKRECAQSPQACRHTSPPAGSHTDILCHNRRRHKNVLNLSQRRHCRHCERPKLVKGKSPQGLKATVQIEQYLLRSAVQLASCSSPATTASRLTSSILPHVSLLCRRRKPAFETCVDNTAKPRPKASVLALRAAGASQLLWPASITLRSYGRRHRSWHYEPQAQANY